MSAVLVVANQKGGVGKTAISVSLAHGLSREMGCKALLVDADPHGGVYKHFRRRDNALPMPYTVTACPQRDINRHIPDLIKDGKYGVTVIDCPAGTSLITRSALIAADVILVPVQPSLADFDAAEDLIPILETITAEKDHVLVLVCISKKIPGNNSYSREAREAAAQFFQAEGINFRILHSSVSNRVDVVRAYSAGKTIYEYAPNSKSRAEFDDLSEEVAQCLNSVLVS